MAHRLGSYDFSRGGATSKYPWDEWLDGRIWRLIGGRDFQVPANNFRRHVCTTAKRRGLRVQTHVQDGDVILQALPLDPEGP